MSASSITTTTRTIGAAVLLAGATLGALAAPASADPDGQPEKVFVCKYVGTPESMSACRPATTRSRSASTRSRSTAVSPRAT